MPTYLAMLGSTFEPNNGKRDAIGAVLASGRWEVRAEGVAAGAVSEKWENKKNKGVFSRPGRCD